MEVGTGSGRILKDLIKFSPKHLTGVEPSNAGKVAKNIGLNKVTFLNIKGEDINFNEKFDFIFRWGVIHHIPQYEKVLKNISKSLKKNGKFIIWVYGKEGNELYLIIFNNLRRLTILPDFILRILCHTLNIFTYFYQFLCFFSITNEKLFLKVFKHFLLKKEAM